MRNLISIDLDDNLNNTVCNMSENCNTSEMTIFIPTNWGNSITLNFTLPDSQTATITLVKTENKVTYTIPQNYYNVAGTLEVEITDGTNTITATFRTISFSNLKDICCKISGSNEFTYHKCEPFNSIKTLYENAEGTQGTVTLNETEENFEEIEIFYKRGSSYSDREDFSSNKVYSPSNKLMSLTLNHYTEAGIIQVYSDKISIIGTSITRVGYRMAGFNIDGFVPSQWLDFENVGTFYIIKVIGYR